MRKMKLSQTQRIGRVLRRDGTFNVVKDGINRHIGTDLYHRLISATWIQFFGIVFTSYLLINFVFAFGYFLCGHDAFDSVKHEGVWWHLLDCFFFSVQTFATIGYGRISPVSIPANLLVTCEALLGMLSVALVTGLLFSRFSRPTARVLFSRVALVNVRDGQPCFFFRMANERSSNIVEAHVSVVLIRTTDTAEGERFRRLYDLKVERGTSPMFALTWTVIHPIDETSPFFNMSKEDLKNAEAEVLVSLTGMDEKMAASVHTRFSYPVDDIHWDQRFKDVLSRDDAGRVHINLPALHEIEPRLG